MMNGLKYWIGLNTLCLLMLGCGGEAEVQTANQPRDIESVSASETLAMIIEVSELTYWRDGEEVNTIDDVRQIVRSMDMGRDLQHTESVDGSHERAGQLRVVFQAKPDARVDVDLQAVSDNRFKEFKQLFDHLSKQTLSDELTYQQAKAESSASSVKGLQQALQAFQESQRGLPQTDASRLERRKLERQIENALQAQIDADKLIASLQKKIDRDRHATLLRVR